MIKDLIGLRADIKIQYDDAVSLEEAARQAYEEAASHRQKLREFLDVIEAYRGERRNQATRLYSAPGAFTKASSVEDAVIGVLREVGRPMSGGEILDALIERDHGDLLPGEERTNKLARLSVYLTRMHRREDDPPLVYDRDQRTFRLKESE